MSTPAEQAPGRMMSVSLKDKATAYYSYMPFLEHGGIFVPTNDQFTMGEEVLLILELLDQPEKHFLRTRVVWINLSRTTNGQPQGVGLAFGDDETAIKCKNYIEDQLPGLLHTDRATYTM
ncbi:PilZ domain-containing protein [Eikenella sp. S3360]|uniref:PilZ domain-containing protein n=1 Tax=Eikenella glucosivorans TaxID=2766967 RepID=A0ABS0NAK9_9NEIS|nr:PilZ domain-containing protein [Eikenella glucosivorans]MBH5329289.1 PilZ domain-containing protein [Eikenella glucosivorans]